MRKATTKTAAIPSSTFVARDIPELIQQIKFLFKKTITSLFSAESNSSSFKQKKMKKFIPLALLVIGLGVVVIVAGRTLSASPANRTQEPQTQVKGPLATMLINKELSFPLLDAGGKEITRVRYTIENAELRDEIIVQGRRATAIQGRVFLILNIKIDNTFDKSLSINSRDYIRLSVNGDTERLFAADIHNDPVSVQAISTKKTRLGFPINTSDTNLVLKVGEIKGTKEDINLSF